MQQVWRSDSTKRQSLQGKPYQYSETPFNNNSLKGSKASLVTPALIDTIQRKTDHYPTQVNSNQTYRNHSQRSKTPTTLSTSAKSNMNYHDSMNDQIIYDEFLNPIITDNNKQANENIYSGEIHYQQQMVWVPRDDIQSNTSPIQSSTTYNSHQHKPQYTSQAPQVTLSNGRELPADLSIRLSQ